MQTNADIQYDKYMYSNQDHSYSAQYTANDDCVFSIDLESNLYICVEYISPPVIYENNFMDRIEEINAQIWKDDTDCSENEWLYMS